MNSSRRVSHSEFPSVDESRDRLHRAGWSVGEVPTTTRWIVSGTNGDDDQPYCLLREMCLGLSPRGQPQKGQADLSVILRFRRGAYDFEATVRQIYDTDGLENWLGDRLREGR
jgi:hypothetical protein